MPTDPKLPNSGQTVTGLFDPNVLVAARNVIKSASDFGDQQQHWNGVDMSVDARLRNGLFLQGGFSTGKTMTDNCDIIDDVPEALTRRCRRRVSSPRSPVRPRASSTPASFCHQETPFLTQYKGLVSYNLPWYGIRVSGTLQSLPGPQIVATNIYNNANRTALDHAGASVHERAGHRQHDRARARRMAIGSTRSICASRRSSTSATAASTSTWTSTTRSTRTRSSARSASIGPVWRLPTTIIQPRFVKFAARWDF